MARPGRLLKACFLGAALTHGGCCHALDDDHPTVGIAYNTKELSALQYECESTAKDNLTCKFTQLSVRKKLTANDVAKRKKQLEESVRSEDLGEQCRRMQEAFDIYDGKKAPPKKPEWKDPRDKEESDAVMRVSGNHAAFFRCS